MKKAVEIITVLNREDYSLSTLRAAAPDKLKLGATQATAATYELLAQRVCRHFRRQRRALRLHDGRHSRDRWAWPW